MFTKKQIEEIRESEKSVSDFPLIIDFLKKIGVVKYKHSVSSGDMTYYNDDETHKVFFDGHQMKLKIAQTTHSADVMRAIDMYRKKEINYRTFCRELATSGVDEWFADLHAMTITYNSLAGIVLGEEEIPVYFEGGDV